MDEVILAKQIEAIHNECNRFRVPTELAGRLLTASERVGLLAASYLRLENLCTNLGRSPFQA